MKRWLIVFAVFVACLSFVGTAQAAYHIKYNQFTYNGVTLYSAVRYDDTTYVDQYGVIWRGIDYVKFKTSDTYRYIDADWWGGSYYPARWVPFATDLYTGTTWTEVFNSITFPRWTLPQMSGLRARWGANPYHNLFTGW